MLLHLHDPVPRASGAWWSVTRARRDGPLAGPGGHPLAEPGGGSLAGPEAGPLAGPGAGPLAGPGTDPGPQPTCKDILIIYIFN